MATAIEKSGERGAMYSTLKAIGGPKKDYVVYLIGQLGVLRCPALGQRLGILTAHKSIAIREPEA